MLKVGKEKIQAAIARYQLFLSVSTSAKMLKPKAVEQLKKKSVELLADMVSGKIEVEQALDDYNQLVKKTNELLPRPAYPELDARSIQQLLRSDIVAFEFFINLDMNAGHLEVKEEVELFNAAMEIWGDVGKEPSSKTLARFSQLVKQTNDLLPKDLHYPVPDSREYPKDQEIDKT